MGTHPIFESDFLSNRARTKKPWLAKETTFWPTPTSTRTGSEESEPGSTSPLERSDDRLPERTRPRLSPHDLPVVLFDQLSDARLLDTTSEFELDVVSPPMSSRALDSLSERPDSSALPSISDDETNLPKRPPPPPRSLSSLSDRTTSSPPRIPPEL